MRSYLSQLLLLGAATLAGFVIYMLLFASGLGSQVTILFYRGVALALLDSIIVGLAAGLIVRRKGEASLPIAAAALSLSFNICFLVLLPVTVDRSVTVYLLSTIERQDKAGIDAGALQDAFIKNYVVDMRAIDRRVDEQRKSGNIAVASDGKIRLTAQGRRFMTLSRLVARLFGTDARFVEGADTSKPEAQKR